ncbi:serine/arginine-rich SC35-like splicing factor SCL30A isoform X2 [Gossypium arboreum]|uniref:serine/arginine-rich SC35-like splicing factor SCL30A isoform X2 n=1 Tax=Gossypium arboreum TaxID=29729 RepID=UPI0022F165DC|nr:serine/arginine-rich SC35-like splicing factor SCL30A isoform X2 [Gossypium arboreum]
MRGRSYTPSPPRGYGRRGRSPSPRGRYGGRARDLPTSLLVRNLRHDCRPEDLRRPFERFGPLKDIYLPKDYYTGEPRGFGFVQYVDPADAAEAKYQMDGQVLLGRELTVVFAEENRKKPAEMRHRERARSVSPQDGHYSRDRYSRSPPYNVSRSCSRSLERGQGPSQGRSRSPRRSRSHSPREAGSPIRSRSRSRSPYHEEYKRELNGERSPSQ